MQSGKREMPAELTRAITACISIGPGSMTNFSINGDIVFKKVAWKKYCVIDANYGGLVIDNVLGKQFCSTDRWSAATMECDVVIGAVDQILLADPKKTKKDTAVPGEIINL